MYLTVKQQLKRLSKTDYKILKDLSHIAKNLMNQAIYNIRQYYFNNGTYLNYQNNYHNLKTSENYKALNSNMAQQILKEVDGSFKSFFGLLKLAKAGKYDKKDIKIPYYLPKDGFTTLVIGFVRLNDNKLMLPYSNSYKKDHKPLKITIPPILKDKRIKEIKIIPKQNARFFEIQYSYEVETSQRSLNKNNALAIDFGVDNLMTCATSTGDSFIIDGRKLKSINQRFNKNNAKIQSLIDQLVKQKVEKSDDKSKNFKKIAVTTKRQQKLCDRRNRRVDDYMSKSAKKVIEYCVANDIGTLVVGYSVTFQRNCNMGKINNQKFVNIPLGKLLDKLKYLCELNSINFVIQEESYTSKASFWNKDFIPVYSSDNTQKYSFSGYRQKRGLYKTYDGRKINADVNGALNILRKSNIVSLEALYAKGDVVTPVRIRVA